MPLPYQDDQDLALVWNEIKAMDFNELKLSPPELQDFQNQTRVFLSIAAFLSSETALTGIAETEQVKMAMISPELLPILGVEAAAGRLFGPEDFEAGAEPVMVIGNGLWNRSLGGDMGALGQVVELDGRQVTVIGVLPPRFRMPLDFTNAPITEVYRPRRFESHQANARDLHYLTVVARRRPEVSWKDAARDLAAATARIHAENSQKYSSNMGWGTRLEPLRERVTKNLRPPLALLFGASIFVLLIACLNFANLLLVRGDERRQELATRWVMGARGGDLLRLVGLEILVLFLVGSGLGLGLAWLGHRLFESAIAAAIPWFSELAWSYEVIAFNLVMALATAAVFGLFPALWRANTAMGSGSAATLAKQKPAFRLSGLRPLLVAVEIALTLILLLGAMLLTMSFFRLSRVDLGFQSADTLAVDVALPPHRYSEPHQVRETYEELTRRIAALPETRAVGLIDQLPITGTHQDFSFTIEGQTIPQGIPAPLGKRYVVDEGLFTALGIPLRKGSVFAPTHMADGEPVAVVNNAATRLWHDRERIIGSKIQIDSTWYTVIGIVGDVLFDGPESTPGPQIYRLHRQVLHHRGIDSRTSMATIVVRGATNPAAWKEAIRQVIWSHDRNIALPRVVTLDGIVRDALALRRTLARLLGVFAVISLLQAAIGTYGVTAYLVGRRTREVGIRLALGAKPRSVTLLFLRQGMVWIAFGVALGLAGAFALRHVIKAFLYHVSALHLPLWSLVVASLTLVSALAVVIPAWRASRVMPMEILREE